MNATLSYEPFKLPAGILALAVHLVFFALLYFGFSWQNTPPEAMSVDLWQSLPEPIVTPPEPIMPTKIIEVIPPSTPPENDIKPDIALPDKKKKIEVKPVTPKAPPQKVSTPKANVNNADDDKPLPKIIVDAKPTAPVVEVDQQALQAARAQQEKVAAENAATKRVVDEYIGRISAKIRDNIVEPQNVPRKARAEFLVTLLPGGVVLNARLIKFSGDPTYDAAVERAIIKSQPLPLPPDVAMFKNFRELKLGFEPEK
ncbi:MAG: cell envelope integrity protein TolA [Gallionella sp.]|nr:cell envelope integrity protein TolA [Gallionella sp.]